MHYKQVANRRKEKWQTGGRDKCLSAAEPSEVLKVWLIRIPSFCVDDSNSVPNLPLPMKNIGKKAPGSFIHKLYGLRSPDPLHKRGGEPDYAYPPRPSPPECRIDDVEWPLGFFFTTFSIRQRDNDHGYFVLLLLHNGGIVDG